jgi:hypothetical protein
MARIRYLKPSFWKDEDIAELPYQIRLFYIALWNFADREGRLEDRPKWLQVEIFPYEKVDIEKMLQQLTKPKSNSNRPFIKRYSVGGKKYIQILAWQEHQRPHHQEPESKIPPPSFAETSEATPKSIRSDTEVSTNQSAGEWRRRMETETEKEKEYILQSPSENSKKSLKREDEDKLMRLWNELTVKYPVLAKVLKISPERRRHLKQRFINKDFMLKFEEVLKKIPKSKFLLGENDRKWVVSFDWLIANDTNYLKILEGKYEERKSEATKKIEEIKKRLGKL